MPEDSKGQTGPGSPSEALTALLDAARAHAAQPVPDARVAAAFALGWQMAELYRPDAPSHVKPATRDDLPGLGRLDSAQREQIALDQVEAALAKLADSLAQSKLRAPDTSVLRKSITAPTDSAGRRPAIRALHVEILATLTAADFRLGKAYGLGRSLADTCRSPVSGASLLSEMKLHRVAKLRGWLDDLASALPSHAGHSVGLSLQRWTELLYIKNAKKPEEAFGEGEQVDRAEEVLPALRRQGQLWRALLSGEKAGTDMLTTANYLDAASSLFVTMGRIAKRFLVRFWWVVVIALLLFAGGVVLILVGTGTSFVAGLGAILASLGITWKSAGNAVGGVVAKADQHLWGAELDGAIVDAITLLPPQEEKKIFKKRFARSRDYAGRRGLVMQSGAPDSERLAQVTVKPELLEPVLNPERLLGKVEELQQAKRAGVSAEASSEATLTPEQFQAIADGITEEKEDAKRVQRAPARQGAAPSAPPPVVYLSRKPNVSQFMSVITHCFEASLASPPLDHLLHLTALDRLWQDIERLGTDLRDRFRQFGPCDIRFIEPKLAELAASLAGRHAFSETAPVAPLASKAKVFLVGDWATGLPQASNVAARIAEQLEHVPPDTEAHVIHLGDTYYSGLEDECRRRFLDLWPVAPEWRTRSWTLAGNHDMYAGGHGYFDVLLADPRFAAQQGCSYFAIANDSWQIIGLDSSYKNPDQASLQDPQQKWLAERVTNAPASCGTILLTHHQAFSAYEEVAKPLPDAVEKALEPRRLSAWFWGHEHRCSVYDPADATADYKELAKYAAVVGHGGVPTMREDAPPAGGTTGTKWEFDDYYEVGDENWRVGGFAVVTIDGADAEVQYYDEYGKERRQGAHTYASEQTGIEQVRSAPDDRPVLSPDQIPRP